MAKSIVVSTRTVRTYSRHANDSGSSYEKCQGTIRIEKPLIWRTFCQKPRGVTSFVSGKDGGYERGVSIWGSSDAFAVESLEYDLLVRGNEGRRLCSTGLSDGASTAYV